MLTPGLKDIQGQMRHARPDTTAGIYMQTIPALQADSVRLFEEMIFGKRPEVAGPIQTSGALLVPLFLGGVSF